MAQLRLPIPAQRRVLPLCCGLVLCGLLLFPLQALASAPSLEQMHQLLLTQQRRLDANGTLLTALEQQATSQALHVKTQAHILDTHARNSAARRQTIAKLQKRAERAEQTLERALSAMTPGTIQSKPAPLAGAFVTATGTKPGLPIEESPFSFSVGPEYLVAYSDSFTYLKSEGPDRDAANARRNQSLGFLVEASYATPSGLIFGLNYHYWNEPEHAATTYTVASSIILGPYGIDADNVEGHVDAERHYADLYVQKALSGATDWQLDLYGGIRAGSFSQNIHAQSLQLVRSWADSSTSYLGAGPLAGLAADWNIVDRFGVVAEGDVAMLLGKSVTDSLSQDSTPDIAHRNITRSLDVAWLCTSRLGTYYTLELDHSRLDFELGLNTEYWTGLPDHIRFTDDQDEYGMSQDTDVLLVGPYFDVRYRF